MCAVSFPVFETRACLCQGSRCAYRILLDFMASAIHRYRNVWHTEDLACVRGKLFAIGLRAYHSIYNVDIDFTCCFQSLKHTEGDQERRYGQRKHSMNAHTIQCTFDTTLRLVGSDRGGGTEDNQRELTHNLQNSGNCLHKCHRRPRINRQ